MLTIRPFLWGITKIINVAAIAIPILFSFCVVASLFILLIFSQVNAIQFQELASSLEQGFNIVGFAFTGLMFTLFGAVSVVNINALYQLFKRSLTYRKYVFSTICSYVCIGLPHLFSIRIVFVVAAIVLMVWASLHTRPSKEPFLHVGIREQFKSF